MKAKERAMELARRIYTNSQEDSLLVSVVAGEIEKVLDEQDRLLRQAIIRELMANGLVDLMDSKRIFEVVMNAKIYSVCENCGVHD
jgi:hypothetical protein